jgi:asparagine synthetase B (glutamine-hydrolysing)
MFIDAKDNHRGTDGFRFHETNQYRISWHGLIYTPGHPAGVPCVAKLAADLQSRRLEQIATDLRGCFCLVVHDKLSETSYALVDNSGLYQCFYSDQAISSSFLDLASFHQLRASDLDSETVVEFLHFGNINFDRTFFPCIRKLSAERIARISPATGISFVDKSLPSFDVPTSYSLEDFLRDFAASVSTEKVSVDLTGGMDTRIIAILLHYFGLPFETAIRGDEQNLDVQIAYEVAETLGKDLQVCHPRIDTLEDDLPGVLNICDGLMNVVTAFGSLQLQYERAERGITLMVGGGGGELFRDHYWLQDFPFYSRSTPNLRRFCNLRLLPTDPDHTLLAAKYREVSTGYRQRLLRDLARYTVPGNTQTYDQITYRALYRESIGRFMTNHSRVLQCSAPYMERDAVRYGYQLPRSTRFFDYYFRKTATKCLPRAARNRTTKNYMTLSAEFSYLAKDIYRYCDDKLTRVRRRVEQRYFHRRHRSCGKLEEPLGHEQLFPTLRRSALVRSAAVQLQDAGILNPALGPDGMKGEFLGTVLTLGLLMDRLESPDPQRAWNQDRSILADR